MNNIDFQISQFFEYLTADISYFLDRFDGFPLVVQICSCGVLFMCLSCIIVIMFLIVKVVSRREDYSIIKRLDEKYRENIKRIILEPRNLSDVEVGDILQFDSKTPFKDNEFRWFIRLLRDVKLECEDKANSSNLQSIMRQIDFENYVQRGLKKSSIDDKIRITRSLRFLGNHMNIEEIISRLKKSKIVVLQKTAIFTYAWNNPNEALAYFESETFEKYHCLYDMMIFHDIMKRNCERGNALPDLLVWINTPEKKASKALFVREMRFLEIGSKCPDLIPVYNASKDGDMNVEIVDNWNHFNYVEAEPVMIQTYSYQEEKVKKAILRAVRNMKTGNAGEFLVRAYGEATDYDVKIESIRSLFTYSNLGFLKTDLDSLAQPGDEHLFKYFKNVA